MLRITPDKIYEIVVKTHSLAVKVDVVEPNYDSNPHGEDMQEILEEDYSDDSTFTELSQFIETLNEDEQIDLVALAWLGRDDYSVEEWGNAVTEATRAHIDTGSTSTAEYLLGIPQLADFLEDGLSKLGLSYES